MYFNSEDAKKIIEKYISLEDLDKESKKFFNDFQYAFEMQWKTKEIIDFFMERYIHLEEEGTKEKAFILNLLLLSIDNIMNKMILIDSIIQKEDFDIDKNLH